MKTSSFYDYDYFERGLMLGISNYTNYHWMPERSFQNVEYIADVAKLNKSNFILDFGCAKGFLVKAFFLAGYPNVYGCDISNYAIGHADPLVVSQCILNSEKNIIPYKGITFDVVTAFHVLEHIDSDLLPYYLNNIKQKTNKLFVRVPLGNSGWFVNPKHRIDISHMVAENKDWWINLFKRNGFHPLQVSSHYFLESGMEDEADFLLERR